MDTSKIIKGVVSNGRYTVTAPIVKEDYGLCLQIEGVDLPSSYQVDFSNSENSGTSITMVGNSNEVRIPTELIETGKDIFAFLYVVGSGYGRTVYKFRIPNKLRPDRTNIAPTPEEQSVIDQVIASLNDAVDRAEDAEQAIEDMSVSAETLAEGASATVTKTESDGVVHLEFGIPKGATGSAGADAKINGVNTLTIEAGTNISLDQEGNTLTINSTGGSGGTSNYNDLSNKPKINNVELNGNKSLNDLGIQPKGNYLISETDPTVPSYVKNISQANITSWNNKSDFSGNYNDLTNKPTIPVVPTNVSAFTNDVGYLTQHQDISGKANKISVVQTSASTIEINPNTFYKFGEVASLNITLASITDNTIYNEYMFEFVSGTTATTLTLPSSIKWLKTPTIDANKIYQCSIVDNVGLLVGVANV